MIETRERETSLADVIARGDLRRTIDGGSVRRFIPSPFDRNVLEVANRAISTRLPTALVLPVPGTTTSVLLAASILVAHVVWTRTLTARIALVTKQTRLRAFYNTLFCGRECLSNYFPPALILPSGALSDIGKHAAREHSSGRLYFAPGLDRVRVLSSSSHQQDNALDGVVIEALATDETEVSQVLANVGGKIPILYLTQDPNDPALPLFKTQGVIWAWNTDALTGLVDAEANPDAVCASPDILRAAATAQYVISSPDDTTEADLALARLWDDLTVIQRHPGGPGFETVRWVWGVFNALSQLIVPMEEYDRYAKSAWGTTALADAPTKAHAYAKNALHSQDREYWEIIAQDLEDATEALRRTNSKPRTLAEWVTRRMDCHETAIVVVKNRPGRLATEACLQARPDVPLRWSDAVRLVTLSEIASGRTSGAGHEPLAAMLFPGPMSARYAGLLAFPSTPQLTILALGPWEAGRVWRQVNSAVTRLNELACGPNRNESIARLFGGQDPGPLCQPQPPRLDHMPVPASLIPSSSRDAVWDPFSVAFVRKLTREAHDMEGPVSDNPQGSRAEVEALRVTFNDGVGFFEPNAVVSKLAGEDIREVAIKALVSGDRVILIDGGAKRDLFDVIVEKLEDLPEFEATAMLVQEWHERVRRGFFDAGLTYREIIERMVGTTVSTSATIGHWVRGTVHGPSDPEDVRRLGHVVRDTFLVDRWRQIGQALATMRAHRRKLGRMLAKALITSPMEGLDDDGYFDRRLGIHYSDLTAAVTVHAVQNVTRDTCRIAYVLANRILNSDEARLVVAH